MGNTGAQSPMGLGLKLQSMLWGPSDLQGLEGRSGLQTCWCHLALTSDWPDRRALRGLGVAEAGEAVGGLVPDTVRHTRLCDTHYIGVGKN